MRRQYITFGGKVYDPTIKLIVENARRYGADPLVWVYDEAWLQAHPFRQRNTWLWDHHYKRGFGWYAWKPLVILDALDQLAPGDMVLYTDADTYPIADFSMLFKEAHKDGIMLFEASAWSNRPWTKRDCYIVMGQDDPKYYDVKHAVARFLVVEAGRWEPRQLLMEWLTYSVNPLATTFDPSVLGPEIEGFREHRTEQSVLTLLAHRYGYKLYREACQAGDQTGAMNDRELYGTLFHQEDVGRSHERDIPTASLYRNV